MLALDVQDLHKTYRLKSKNLKILSGLNLQVAVGEFTLLIGSSGCGKTTLLHLLGALDQPDSGSIHCFGQDLATLRAVGRAKLRAEQLSFVFQSFQLLNEFTALENIALAGRIAGRSPTACRVRAEALLAQVGLQDRAAHLPTELSGGEQQRVALARSLMNEPRLILADEPTGNLDDASSLQIMDLLQDLHRKGCTIVMVTHDRRHTQSADRVLTLRDGALHESEC